MSCAVASSVTRRKIFINFFLLSPQRCTTERDHTLVHHKDFLKWLRSERRAVKCCTSSKSALMQKNTHCRRRAKKAHPCNQHHSTQSYTITVKKASNVSNVSFFLFQISLRQRLILWGSLNQQRLVIQTRSFVTW